MTSNLPSPSAPETGEEEALVEQLRIGAEPGVVLAATLHLPLGRGRAPFPVMLAIPGGGPGGRHCYDFLKRRFLDDGIAMLEYDKRGVWESTGEHTDALSVQVSDATVMIDFLRSRPDIDGDRIALIGLCHGGVVAPQLAVRDSGIAAVVLLSGPVGPGPVLFLRQMKAALLDDGMRQPLADRLTDDTRRLFEARSRGAAASTIADLQDVLVESFVVAGFRPSDARGAMFLIDTAESLSMWNAEPDQALANVRAPVLALYGSIDTFVSPSTNVPAARAALAANPDATVIELPGMNHLFQHSKTGSRQEMRDLGAPNSAPEMIHLVGDWVSERLNPPSRTRVEEKSTSSMGVGSDVRLS
jgi:pimeloyl-ACP methyl ester carboxylesterase